MIPCIAPQMIASSLSMADQSKGEVHLRAFLGNVFANFLKELSALASTLATLVSYDLCSACKYFQVMESQSLESRESRKLLAHLQPSATYFFLDFILLAIARSLLGSIFIIYLFTVLRPPALTLLSWPSIRPAQSLAAAPSRSSSLLLADRALSASVRTAL